LKEIIKYIRLKPVEVPGQAFIGSQIRGTKKVFTCLKYLRLPTGNNCWVSNKVVAFTR